MRDTNAHNAEVKTFLGLEKNNSNYIYFIENRSSAVLPNSL